MGGSSPAVPLSQPQEPSMLSLGSRQLQDACPEGPSRGRETWSHHSVPASVASLGIRRCPPDPLILPGQQVLILEFGLPCPNCWKREKARQPSRPPPAPGPWGQTALCVPGLASVLMEGLPDSQRTALCQIRKSTKRGQEGGKQDRQFPYLSLLL